MKRTTCLSLISVGLMLLSTFATAGTYQVVAVDTSLVTPSTTGTGASSSFSAGLTGCHYDLTAHASNGPVVDSVASVQGQVTWTVRWTPSVPGEPVPLHPLVQLNGAGTIYGTAYVGAYAEPWVVVRAEASVNDPFMTASTSETRSQRTNHLGSESYAAFEGLYASVGTFTEVSPGVYEAPLVYELDSTVHAHVESNGPLCDGYVNADVYLHINQIGTQVM